MISNLVFLPKPGKDDYSDPRSYRPISLLSFLMKAMEKVVRDGAVRTKYWNMIGTDQLTHIRFGVAGMRRKNVQKILMPMQWH